MPALKFSVSVGRQPVVVDGRCVYRETFDLFYLEIVNNGVGDVKFSAWDGDGLAIIPEQTIAKDALLTYKCKVGSPANGLWWRASTDGLCGWFKGRLLL